MFGEVLFQCLLLSKDLMALALAVVLQTEKRAPFCRKGTAPFRQNDPAIVQYLTDSFGIYFCVQEIDRPRPLPNQGVNLSTEADRFSFCALVIG